MQRQVCFRQYAEGTLRTAHGNNSSVQQTVTADYRRMAATETIFSQYVRVLAESGQQPSEELFETVWRRLRHALRGELTRRGLWNLPPRFVGISGSPRWNGENDGPLEELTADCYQFIFIARAQSLYAQLQVKAERRRTRLAQYSQLLVRAAATKRSAWLPGFRRATGNGAQRDRSGTTLRSRWRRKDRQPDEAGALKRGKRDGP